MGFNARFHPKASWKPLLFTQLLEVLKLGALEPDVVVVVAPAFGRILLAATDQTIESLANLDALSSLAHCVKVQQHCYSAAQVSLQPLNDQVLRVLFKMSRLFCIRGLVHISPPR